jgi:protein-tyrosine phosphatase
VVAGSAESAAIKSAAATSAGVAGWSDTMTIDYTGSDVTPTVPTWASKARVWVGPEINSKDNVGPPWDTTVFQAMKEDVRPTRIINCRSEFKQEEDLLGPAGAKWLNAAGDNYKYNGVKDWSPAAGVGLQPLPDSFFKNGIDFWKQYRDKTGEVVLVHCTQGVNRSVTLAYAIMLAEGLNRGEAMLALNERRKVTVVSDVIDHPWWENAEHALIRLGLLHPPIL